MRRRTRLRKLGLAPDPKAATPKRREPTMFDVAQEMARQGMPSRFLTDWNVVESCRRHGVAKVLVSLQQTGMTPEGWYPR